LGQSTNIGKVVALWGDWFYRDWAYQYTIGVSENGATFTTVVDRTGNTTAGETTDTFSAQGRYVRITIVAGNPSAYVAAREFKVYGDDGPISISITDADGQPVEELKLNDDGWPVLNAEGDAVANPLLVTATMANTTGTPYQAVATLMLTSTDDLVCFYATPPESCSAPHIERHSNNEFSYALYESPCQLVLPTDGVQTLSWRVWVQPSVNGTLNISAQLRRLNEETVIATVEDTVQVPRRIFDRLWLCQGFWAPTQTITTATRLSWTQSRVTTMGS
jgi:hypothetical protein